MIKLLRLLKSKHRSSPAISRQRRSFLLLELLIALFLVGTVALPLSELPMRAIKEEMKSLYRTQARRLADLGFAHLKEKLYKNQVPWEDIVKASKEHILVLEESCDLSFSALPKKFLRKVYIKQASSKVKGQEEWILLVVRVEIIPQGKGPVLFRKKNDKKAFAYYCTLHKTPHAPKEAV